MDIVDEMQKNRQILKIEVATLIKAMNLTAQDDTYDKKCSVRFAEKFNRIQYSYGALLSFTQHVRNCSKYFVCENCVKIADEIHKVLRKFINAYEPIL